MDAYGELSQDAVCLPTAAAGRCFQSERLRISPAPMPSGICATRAVGPSTGIFSSCCPNGIDCGGFTSAEVQPAPPASPLRRTRARHRSPPRRWNIAGTWEHVGGRCTASFANAEGNYFKLASASYLAGTGSQCQDPASILLAADGNDTRVDIDAKCTFYGHGVLISISTHHKASQGLLLNYEGANVVQRYERCESVQSSFGAQLQKRYGRCAPRCRLFI
jgi:hypothetical protein